MGQANHFTFQGNVYCKKKEAMYTYRELSNPQIYVDKLLKMAHISPQICEYANAIKLMLQTADNPLCDDIVFHYDFVEVSIDRL